MTPEERELMHREIDDFLMRNELKGARVAIMLCSNKETVKCICDNKDFDAFHFLCELVMRWKGQHVTTTKLTQKPPTHPGTN
jgi:hypothetical protein